MTRLERCELFKSKGFTYNPETGKIYGIRGKEIISKNKDGYIKCMCDRKEILGHHFAWFMIYDNVDFIELDHKNRNRDDNRISNLRISTRSQQGQNRDNVKGYTWDKNKKKWKSYIMLDQKYIFLGYYDIEQDARNSYLEAKKKYHMCLADPN